MGALRYHRSCSYYGIAFHRTVVHNDGAHPDQHIILNMTAVNNCVMAYRHDVTYYPPVFLVTAGKQGIVLLIYPIAHCYLKNIVPAYAVVLNTALSSHANIATGSCGFCQKCIIAYLLAL